MCVVLVEGDQRPFLDNALVEAQESQSGAGNRVSAEGGNPEFVEGGNPEFVGVGNLVFVRVGNPALEVESLESEEGNQWLHWEIRESEEGN